MGCGCNKKKKLVDRFVVDYNDGTTSDPFTTAWEAAAEKRSSGAIAPVRTVKVDPQQPAAPKSPAETTATPNSAIKRR